MSRFALLPTALAGLTILEGRRLGDQRGYLQRLFCVEDLAPILGGRRIVQINRTHTARAGTVRGLHFQRAPHSETKIVTCIRGEVFDVAVDLRASSPTYLQWHAETLSEATPRSLWIPEGFAHGFQALGPECELLYLHTQSHHPESEGGLDATDPAVGVPWPLEVAERSARDASLPRLTAAWVSPFA